MVKSLKLSKSDTLFIWINESILVLSFLLVAYPLIYIISSSFSAPHAVISGKVFLWPVDFSLEGYIAIFKHKRIISGYGNTLFYTLFGTFINVILTILAAYPLSRKRFIGRNALMFLFTFTMIFHGGLIPTYLMVQQLGMVNTRWALLIPNAIGVWNVIITRTYFQNTIRNELMEAAQLDGCNHFRFLLNIVLPLSKAITAVLVLFYAVSHWNSFFDSFIYLSREELYPLQIILRDILVMNSIDPSMIEEPETMVAKQGMADLLRYSLIIAASLPVWCVYPIIQKHFVKGVMIGAIKG